MNLLPGAVWRPISYRTEAHPMRTNPYGIVCHVQVGSGSPWSLFENAPPNGRRFSHGWVAKDGYLEQYQDLTLSSWSQVAGNRDYWAFEFEGMPSEKLTPAQILTAAKIHNYLRCADRLADHPGELGQGTHYMGGAAWGGHTCPDEVPGKGPRSLQRRAIIEQAIALRTHTDQGGSPVTPEDAQQFLTTLADWDVSALCGEPAGTVNFQTALGRIYKWGKAAATQSPQK